ncbi:MAG: adenylate kinase [Gammaproteobacteria bacterium]|nr:adenylate kinase [Gammaproteobacteria bacterium]
MIAVFLGPPGAGKGTQSAKLIRDVGFRKIATGDLLRAARQAGTELGEEARRYMDAGELVPDEVIVALVEETLGELPADAPILFDGFPRTLPQARALDEALARTGRAVQGVVVLDVPERVVLRRIGGRRISPNGRVYNIHDDPPRVDGVCDDTGEALIHRKDDRPQTILRRLGVYEAQTEPIVAYYEEGGPPVARLDGTQGIEETYRSVRAALRRMSAGESEPRSHGTA